ncbi:MAG: hypothetical protein ACREQ4_03505 [Candidatus Binataceae bacterium]
MIDWFGQGLGELPPSYKRVIPIPGSPLTIRVSGYQLGTRTVHAEPGNTPREKVAIGLSFDRIDKPDPIHQWAIISPEATAILEGQLSQLLGVSPVITIAIMGKKPQQHWIITRSASA